MHNTNTTQEHTNTGDKKVWKQLFTMSKRSTVKYNSILTIQKFIHSKYQYNMQFTAYILCDI